MTCPNCNSLLDVNQGQLSFLKALEKPTFQPAIPLGSTGDVPEGKMTVIGAMSRSVTIEGTQYFWSEYLLYNPQIGFRWLVQSDDHWNYVQAVPPGEVSEGTRYATFRGKNYRIFQDAPAQVESVLGEFYWKVEAGEESSRRRLRFTALYAVEGSINTMLPIRPTRDSSALPERSTGRWVHI